MGINSHLKERAISLRKDGKSYNEIRKILDIKSKGTLSDWFRNIPLSLKAQKLLEKNTKLAYKRGLFTANKARRTRIDAENEEACAEGQNCIGPLSERELLLIGASMYWGEGTKSEKNSPILSFSNSDPLMASLYMRFLREILRVSEERIHAAIHLYPSISPDEARKFWAKVINFSENKFYITTQVSRASQNKRPFNILPYGTVNVRVSNRLYFFKVKGMIKGIANNTTSLSG
jgi:hypothetical protein